MSDTSIASTTDTLQDLERALLAYLISRPSYASQVRRQLEASDFSLTEYQQVYQFLTEMLDSNPDAYGFITLQRLIDQSGLKINVQEYQEYLGLISSDDVAQEIVANILESSVKRRLKQELLMLHSRIDTVGIEEIEGTLKDSLSELMKKGYGVSSDNVVDIQNYVDEFIEFLTSEDELPIIYHLGIDFVQPSIVDFAPSNLTVIGARPGSGKTTLMINSAYQNARNGIPVHVFSYEMTPRQISARLVSMATGIEPRFLLRKTALFDQEKIRQTYDYINSIPFRMTSPRAKTISELETLIRLSVLRYGTQIVYIDYLQLLSSTKRSASRYETVSEASDMLMNIARELGIAVFVNSQLRRKAGAGSDYEPGMDDLKESGDIEQDASLIALLWRVDDDEDSSDGEPHPDSSYKWRVKLRIAKQRNSSSGQTYDMVLNARFTKFEPYKEGEKNANKED